MGEVSRFNSGIFFNSGVTYYLYYKCNVKDIYDMTYSPFLHFRMNRDLFRLLTKSSIFLM